MRFVIRFLISIVLFAGSESLARDGQSVSLDAAIPVRPVALLDHRYEPVYGEEPYPATCSREVFSHNDSVCHTVQDTVCQGGVEVCSTVQDSVCNSSGCVSVPRRVCHTPPRTCSEVPRRVCESRPVYRTEFYSCTRYRTVVIGQKLVKTYQHRVNVRLEDPAAMTGRTIHLSVSADEDDVSAALSSSFPEALLIHSIERVRDQDAGDLRSIESEIVIRRGLSAAEVGRIETGGISKLELGRSAIRMELPGLAGLESALRVRVELKRTPKAWFKTTLYRDEIAVAGLGWISQGDSIRAVIPFGKIGIGEISGKRHDLEVSVGLDPRKVLNVRDFSGAFARRIESRLEKVEPSF